MRLFEFIVAGGLLCAGLPALAQSQSAGSSTVVEVDQRLPDHTVYRPAALDKVKGKLPIVAFGNGGCYSFGTMFEPFLRAVAAQGYLVAAPGAIFPPGTSVRTAAPRAQNKTDQLFATISWAVAENARKGSPYYGRIDTRNIALMGQSCGGLQVLAGGADSRVKTVVVLNSGIIRGSLRNPDGTTRTPAYLPASETDLKKLHTPIVYLIGGPKDQAYPNAEADFAAIDRVPIFNGNFDAGHLGTWVQPDGGEMARPVIAWLNWQLKGDRSAAKMFAGAQCGLCVDGRWKVKKKNLP